MIKNHVRLVRAKADSFPWLRSFATSMLLFVLANANAIRAQDSLRVYLTRPPFGNSILGYTQSFPYPALSIISVIDKDGKPLPGLATKSRWSGPGDRAENSQLISEIWQPINEYFENTPSLGPSDLYDQRPPPMFAEVCDTCETVVPSSIMLLMDMSSSIREERLQKAREGLIHFVSSMRPEDRAGVIQFADTTDTLPTLPMTTNKDSLIAFINSGETRDWTPLYRALLQGIHLTKGEQNPRRCIVIYTDGRRQLARPEQEYLMPDSVIVDAKKFGIPIFTIALGKRTNEVVLRNIARETGGLFFKTSDGTEFDEIYDQIFRIINNYYVLAYLSPNPCALDSARVLDVSVNDASLNGRGVLKFTQATPQNYDLRLTINSSTEELCPGDEVSYAVEITNLGPSTAYNVVVRDTIPAYLTPLDFEPAPEAGGENVFTWRFTSLEAGQKRRVTLVARVNNTVQDQPGDIRNSAQVFSSCDTNSSNDRAVNLVSYDPAKCLPDLSISQSVKTDSLMITDADSLWYAVEGETFPYFVTLRNETRFTATGIRLEDILPDSVRTADGQQTLTWEISELSPFSDTTLTFLGTVAARMPEGINLLVNTAHVRADNEDPTKLANSSSQDTVYNYVEPRVSDLGVAVTAHTDSFAVSGVDTVRFAKEQESYTYMITVSNSAKHTAENVRLTQVVPDSVQIEDHPPGDTIVVALGDLAPFAEIKVERKATVASRMPEGTNSLISTVFVDGDNENPLKTDNNKLASTVLNYVEPRWSDISVSTHVRTDSFTVQGADSLWFARAGETYTYRVELRNQAKYAAENVNIENVVPELVTLSGPNIEKTGRVSVGRLEPFSRADFSFTATLSAELGSEPIELTHVTEAEADNENPNELADNRATATVFTVPPKEACNLFMLDRNVYTPGDGAALGINFELESSRMVQLDLYDISGHHVTKLIEAPFATGRNRFEWNGTKGNGQQVGSGVYIVTLRSGSLLCWKKVILAR